MPSSKLTPYVEKSNSNHHCEFCHNRSCTDNVLCICHMFVGGDTTAAVHIQSKLASVWEVLGY